MLNNNVNAQQQNIQQQFQSLTPQQQEQLRQQIAMQAVNPELLKENIQDTYVANRVSETTQDPKAMLITGALTVPTWYALAESMDKFAAKSRGDYSDTVHAKIGNLGDRISNSNFFQSSPFKWINKQIKSTKNWISANILSKTKLTRGLSYAESRPELGIVRAQAEGMVGIIGQDWHTVSENFMKPKECVKDLAGYGATPADISRFENAIKNVTGDARLKVLQEAEFECLKKYTRDSRRPLMSLSDFKAITDKTKRLEILNDMKAFELGLKDYKEYKTVSGAVHDYLPRIMEASHNSNKNMYSIAYGAKPGLLGWIKRKLFNRNVYFSEFSNKMAASLGKQAKESKWQAALERIGLKDKLPISKLGQILAKSNNIFLESATNRVAGGKLAAIFQAGYLADVLYKTAKHEGNFSEKMKSFAERFAEMVAFFACIPIGLKLMHKIGGMQYAGMDKNAIETFRQNLAAFNEKAMSGGFANKEEWKVAKKALQSELKAGVKNPFVKFVKKIGRIVTVGLEQIRPYDKKSIGVLNEAGEMVYRKGVGEKIKDLFRHPKFGLKQMAGYPMRIILGMMVILPFLSKLCVKGTHLIVGKPKKSILDEGKEEQQAQQVQQTPQQQLPPQLEQPVPSGQQSDTNLLNKYKNSVNNQPANVPARTYIPSSVGAETVWQNSGAAPVNNNTNNNSQEPYRSYIPSPTGIQVAPQDDSAAVMAAMQRSQVAEQEALKTLKMN